MTKSYDFTMTTPEGEVYSANNRFTSMWEAIGWDVYKNDNFIAFVTNNAFCLDGVNVVCKDLQDAVRIGRRLERIESEAETAFFKSHPELNP